MTQLFTAFLVTSAIGTALAFILTLLRPVTKKIFSSSWHYYMWLIVLLVMVFPIRLNLPEKSVTTQPVDKTVTITNNHTENIKIPVIAETQPQQIIQEQPVQTERILTVQNVKNFLNDRLLLFSIVWLTGTVLLFVIKIISYLVFLIKIHKHSKLISCPEVKAYTKRKVKTRVSNTICSPLMIGIIRPTLLLPEKAITPEQLHNVLAHEMTHLSRNDILYKWFVNVVKCVHWFNPAIYFISNQINIDCEISCDLAVVKGMDKQQEKGYVETILSLLSRNNSKAVPLTTGMTGNKKTLKRRFIMIKRRKHIGKATQILSTILAVMILATTVLASGVLATEILKNDNSENTLDIEVRHNGFLVALTNKPFLENNALYLPLRELLEKTGLVNNEDGYIKWDNGKITLCITEGYNFPEYDDSGNIIGNRPVKIQYYYGIEIGKAEYTLNPVGTLPEERHHLSMSKEMNNAPILKDGITYIPYEYIDYMVNRVMQNHKIIVWEDANRVTAEDISNAENMTYEDIRNLQISVDNGHFPWRLDPAEVIKTFLLSKGISVDNIRVPESTVAKLTYTDGDIEIELFKPIDKTKSGIWIVKSFRYGRDNEICAFVKEIKGNKIVVDIVEYVSDEDTERIAELNLTDFDMPNGYYINNPEIELEEYVLTETSTYSFIDWKNDFVEFGEDRRVDTTDKKDFIKYLNSYENSQPKMPFFLDIVDGKVIKITEIPLM